LQCGEFDQGIEILYGRMVIKVIDVLRRFLGSRKSSYDACIDA
jgi:hypothetical protein